MIKREKTDDEFEKEVKGLFKLFNKKVNFDLKENEKTKADKLLEKIKNKKERKAGILMHPTSLPGNQIVGTLGKEAYEFVDFLKKANQSLWQIFPLGPTGYNDSPYQCFSAFAGNPYLIDLNELVNEEILSEEDIKDVVSDDDLVVDYGKLYLVKNKVLEKAYENKDKVIEEFNEFKKSNSDWLDDYALFMSLKKHFNGASWFLWDEDIKNRKSAALDKYTKLLETEIETQKFMQFLFFRQWLKLKEYANDNNIEIIGDIPIFVSSDSVDAWANSSLFVFESVAGVPPDYFSATGQLWGNPLYNWEVMKKDKYAWWKKRFNANLKLYDIIRLDHFRGFESYWAIPKDEKTAINGEWKKGPSYEFFEEIYKDIANLNLIAEDLGSLTEDVVNLKNKLELPGMKILQFAFSDDPKNLYLPHNYEKNCVVYTGTHDNTTTLAWYLDLSDEKRGEIRDYLDINDDNGICWHLIRLVQRSSANMCIIPIQDYISYGKDARINTPGVASGNWQWRIKKGVLNDDLANAIAHITRIYGR